MDCRPRPSLRRPTPASRSSPTLTTTPTSACLVPPAPLVPARRRTPRLPSATWSAPSRPFARSNSRAFFRSSSPLPSVPSVGANTLDVVRR
ncbi:Hypothetical protein, putative [Bodo saltans]|uniref:Uncharacterized protein n=1 Tax=Bodo saltans TaxID=75058 RepID=A0A0S4KG33_BODSA|nr:Hypothetical protein, putative [Bodo saltans]|eukprot:CUI14620.1 Hypothetical protein, putative [Bodo saltans]